MKWYKFFREQLHFITVVALAVVFIWTAFNNSKWRKNEVIRWDVYGYTMYLSSALIYHDIKTLKHFDDIDLKYHPCGDRMGYARHDCGGGNKALKYTCGNALMMAPFYVTAHLLTVAFGTFSVDGYSEWYQMSVALSTIFWGAMGLFFLVLILKRWLNPAPISIAIICLGFGTNFFYYTTLETGMTHIPSFFWFSFSCYCYLKWFENRSWKYALLTGLSFGFIALLRLTDMIYAIIPAVLFVTTFANSNAREKTGLILQASSAVLIAFFLFSIQMLYWKYVSGNWFHYSYTDEKFDFANPHILDGLFSYKKGWLLYTPVMIFALAGIPLLLKRNLRLGIGILLFLILNVFVVFSWWMWWYGAGFGARSMIQSYAVLCIPLAFVIQWIVERISSKNKKQRVIATSLSVILLFFIALNLFQTYQYKRGTLHYDSMTKKSYWGIWGKLTLNEKEYEECYE